MKTACVLLYGLTIAISAQWQQLALEGTEVTAMHIGSKLVVGTNGRGIYWYDDSTALLSPIYSLGVDTFELFMRRIHSIYNDNEWMVFAGSDSGLYSYMPSSFNPHWTRIIDIPEEQVMAVIKRDDMFLVATQREIYRSDSGGSTFQPLNADSALPAAQSLPTFTSLAAGASNLSEILAGSMFNGSFSSWFGVLRSLDRGTTWLIHNEGLVPPVNNVYALCFFRQIFSDINGAFACGTASGVYWYPTVIENWQPLKPGVLDSRQVNDLFVSTYSNSDIPELFACTDSGAYLLSAFPQGSFDDATWRWLNYKGKTYCAQAYSQSGAYVGSWFVGTQDGLYKYSREPVLIQKIKNDDINGMPAIDIHTTRGKITIRCNTDRERLGQITLLDVRGRAVKMFRPAENMNVIISLDGLVRGVYFLHIYSEKNHYINKIFLR